MATRFHTDTATTLAASATIVLWASAFAGIRAGLQGYGPGPLALLRYLTASLTLAACAGVGGVRRPARRDLWQAALIGVIGIGVYNLALNLGERSVTAGEASLLVSTTPIFTALLATVWLGERLGTRGWLGLAIGFTGAALIATGHHAGTSALPVSPGAPLVLLAAASQAAYFVLQRPLLRAYRPLEVTTYAIFGGTLSLLIFLPDLVREIRTASSGATLAAVYLGIFPAALGYLTWSVVLARMPAARAASLLYVIPAIAFAVGWLWLGERPDLRAVGGGALAVGGAALASRRQSVPKMDQSAR